MMIHYSLVCVGGKQLSCELAYVVILIQVFLLLICGCSNYGYYPYVTIKYDREYFPIAIINKEIAELIDNE